MNVQTVEMNQKKTLTIFLYISLVLFFKMIHSNEIFLLVPKIAI